MVEGLHPLFSLVIPAFNEASRLPSYLREVRDYMDREFPSRYEVIVVNDGSRDGTDQKLGSMMASWPELRVLHHERNRGKGAAVKTGILASRGTLVLFTDADGATPIAEEHTLRSALENGADVAIGSRVLDQGHRKSKRSLIRAVTAGVFRRVVRMMVSIPFLDTQCGFKMFRGDRARALFDRCQETGYLFDLEVLMLARKAGDRIVEKAIIWNEQPGSKLSLWRDAPRLLADLWRLRQRQFDP
jgi:dolichyl-phosphate beta-glucosyltransferase